MGSAPKQPPPPLPICWKWPWDVFRGPMLHPHNPQSASPCNSSDPPLLLKSLHSLGSSLAANLFGAAAVGGKAARRTQNDALRVEAHGVGGGGGRRAQPLSKEEQGEAEQRAFAAALASGKEATVLEFYSPRCRLCSSLLDLVLEVDRRNSDWVSLALADAENERWLPEVVHYDIKYVPCFVLLDKYGRALAKTGVPTSRRHVIAGLSHLLKLKRPQGFKSNDVNV